VRQPLPAGVADLTPAKHAARKVVLVTSPGLETSLVDVVMHLASISAEVGQSVVIVGTAGLEVPEDGSGPPLSTPSLGSGWHSSPIGVGLPREDVRARLMNGSVDPADVEERLGDTGVPGVWRLDLRYFIGHPAQAVIRAPEVVAALEKIVDVVILEVPSYLSVHHGEGLTPLADVVLVVGERRTTTVGDIKRTKAALKRLGAPVVGMALTRSSEKPYVWGHASELEEQPKDDDPETEQLPIFVPESAGFAPEKWLDEVPAGDDAPPEA
jgi:hypothetical protein